MDKNVHFKHILPHEWECLKWNELSSVKCGAGKEFSSMLKQCTTFLSERYRA